MSNEIQTAQNNQIALPAHLAALFAGKSNVTQQDSIPSLSYKGKVFSVNLNGAHKQLLDSDGNPLPMVEVIILNANPRRSRTFFAGKFTENDGGKSPDCHSYDGKRPANDIEEPQSSNCETCPQAVKGSRTNDKGQPVTACQLRQRAVVVPSDKPDFEALLVNMASTSAFDKESPDAAHGWYAFDQYKKELAARGIPHTAAVKTKIRFAPSDAYPRLQFKFSGLLDESAMVTAANRADSEEVLVLLNKDYNKPPVEHKTIVAPSQPTNEPPPQRPQPDPEPFTAGFGMVNDAAPQPVQKEPPKAAKPAPKAEQPKAKPAPVVVEDEADLNSILSSWDN